MDHVSNFSALSQTDSTSVQKGKAYERGREGGSDEEEEQDEGKIRAGGGGGCSKLYKQEMTHDTGTHGRSETGM